jgi:hypothetical protein
MQEVPEVRTDVTSHIFPLPPWRYMMIILFIKLFSNNDRLGRDIDSFMHSGDLLMVACQPNQKQRNGEK